MVKSFKYSKPWMITILITLILVVLVIFEVKIPILHFLEMKSIDLRFRIRGTVKAGGDVVIAAIDDPSIDAIGRWPWPRNYVTALINILHQSGCRSIGVDLLFSEAERNMELGKLQKLAETYTNMGLLNDNPMTQAFFSELIDAVQTSNNDANLALMMKQSQNTILAMAFQKEAAVENKNSPPALRLVNYKAFTQKMDPLSFSNCLSPQGDLAKFAAHLGFVNVKHDDDGSIRKAMAISRTKHAKLDLFVNLFTSLPIRAVQQFAGEKDQDIIISKGSLKIGAYDIPIDQQGLFYINYYGPNYTIPYYSFVDVLSGAVPPETFKDKIVFIGGAATGLGDHWPNPFVGNYLGVETQAVIADNILTGRFIQRPAWLKYADAGRILLLGVIMLLLLTYLPIIWAVVVASILILIDLINTQYLFNNYHLVILFVYPLAEILLVGFGVFLQRFLSQGHEKRILKDAFQQYLNPSVVKRILKNPQALKLGGDKKQLSILFSDIRGFTSISEGMEPDALVEFMNKYLTVMTDIIFKNNGTLDKYIGDAMMALYGAPESLRNHTAYACRSALMMIEELYRIRNEWVSKGLPFISIGIGINTGEVVVGNMGSEKRFDYTAMGDHVNLASRLEGMSKMYGVKIVVSEFTRDLVKEQFTFRELDLVRVKGRVKPVKIYELLDKDYFTGGKYTFIESFQRGLQAFRNQQWEEAIAFFKQTNTLKKDDKPSALFIDRCHNFKKTRLPENWNGVYIAVNK